MQLSNLLLIGTASVCTFLFILWLLQIKWKEADIVDFGWTVSLGFLGVFYGFFGSADLITRTFVILFSAIWSYRLGSHLWKRVKEPGEDGRYQHLREKWGSNVQFNFFIFFQAQAILAVLLSLSFLIPATQSQGANRAIVLFALVWFLLAILGEAFADLQLRKFRENPDNKGKTCRYGLWKYSRHPNYFFEWLYWFSYSILSIGSPYWVLTLISPLLMLFFIFKITGIPPTEERALRTRGDDYRDYQRTTSAFFPWFPKKASFS